MISLKQLINKHFIALAVAVAMGLIMVSAISSYFNHQAMEHSLALRNQSQAIIRQTENTVQNIWRMDISIRGYALMREDRFYFLDSKTAQENNQLHFKTLDSLMEIQQYPEKKLYDAMKIQSGQYVKLFDQMSTLVRDSNMVEFKEQLGKDQGKALMNTYTQFELALKKHEATLMQQAQAEYKTAVLRNAIVQILLLLVGLPTLGLMVSRLYKERRNQKSLLLKLEANNRQFLFNPGSVHQEDAHEILENSIQNLKNAANFVTQISEGNYQVDWEALDASNRSLNQQNLVGRLIHMREQMKQAKVEDEKRMWATEGLANFSEIVRNHQHDLAELSYQSVMFAVKYLQAQQGSLFVLREEEGMDSYLELTACYAFNRKKYLEKRINIGEGLIGQTYLERESVMMTQLPPNYTYIHSGLGDATPNCLLIVPMIYNEQVCAIIEIASFKKYERYQIEFLEKVGEFVASSISSARTNEKTKALLEQFQIQTEQMRAQEEEMRQNMEELQATQEEMRRKEQEMERRLMDQK